MVNETRLGPGAARRPLSMLKKYGMLRSISSKGNCYDNAVAESFFSSFKNGIVHPLGLSHSGSGEEREAIISASTRVAVLICAAHPLSANKPDRISSRIVLGD